ncbi:mitochondrial 54S ribosomal protein YmL7/YmL5 [Pichia kluyveri]|uniref:Large ribosomal subunit protein uL5m n=1 Tax=Pichia kluyveri TaxID=36015 RepID=A0AAV5R2S3_PICKL|nr:mitochondrial 54S ribosomal protein YmL7/YmL5 [Pichia kluyveri]
MTLVSVRSFSSSVSLGKAACAQVKPVHHKVRIIKKNLSPRFPELKYPSHDIKSPKFRPYLTHLDRVDHHYHNVLESDLLLIGYRHGQQPIYGNKRRHWDMSSPYQINRPLRKPKGQIVPSQTINPRDTGNIAKLQSISINCFVKDAKQYPAMAIGATLQLQQITGVKPKPIYAKTNVPNWKLRPGMKMGAKVELFGRDASQFLSTLTEIVLPRIGEFNGISNRAGDRYGNIAFGLTSDHIKYFPEIELNQDSWPNLYGFDITLHTTAQTDADARILLSGLGLPFVGSERIPKTLLDDLTVHPYEN